jgi:ribonucleotide monophosphatase NagD (HAD superfamily)
MPGTLAKQYRDLGGHVQLMGKPDPIIYAAAQQLASGDGSSSSSSSTQERWLAIGDSLEHDVAG